MRASRLAVGKAGFAISSHSDVVSDFSRTGPLKGEAPRVGQGPSMICPEPLKKNEPLLWSTGTGAERVGPLLRVHRGRSRNGQAVGGHGPVDRSLPLRIPHAAVLRRAGESARGRGVPARPRRRSAGCWWRSRRSCDAIAATSRWSGCWKSRYASMHGASPEGEPIAAAIRARDLERVRQLLDQAPRLATRRGCAIQSADSLGGA